MSNWLAILNWDRDGYITLLIQGKKYIYSTSTYIIDIFLKQVGWNKGRALSFLKKHSKEVKCRS